MSTLMPAEKLQAAEVIVRGRVQGVGFRAFTRRNALVLDLRGTVSNQPDGTVKVYMEGEPERIQQMLLLLREGPSLAKVEQVEVTPREPTGQYHTFEVGLRM